MPHYPQQESAADRQARFAPIVTGEDYIASLRNRGVDVYLFGERIDEPVDHPIIRPSINALRATYDLAISDHRAFAADQRAGQPVPAYRGKPGRSGDEKPDAAAHGAIDRHVFSALRRA